MKPGCAQKALLGLRRPTFVTAKAGKTIRPRKTRGLLCPVGMPGWVGFSDGSDAERARTVAGTFTVVDGIQGQRLFKAKTGLWRIRGVGAFALKISGLAFGDLGPVIK